MNFLPDESCAGPVLRALREAGHDVIAVCARPVVSRRDDFKMRLP
jgi:hypothetical protein